MGTVDHVMRLSRGNVLFLIGVVFAGLVVVAVDASRDGDSCAEWQERYRAAAPPSGGAGALDFVNMGPLAELRADRPEGCAIPD